MQTATPKLDAQEEHFRIPCSHGGISLFARYPPPTADMESLLDDVLTGLPRMTVAVVRHHYTAAE
jgi:hypothetical protein